MEYFLGQVADGGMTVTELLDQDNLPPLSKGSNIEITLLDAKEKYDMIIIPIFHTKNSPMNYISYSLLVTEGEQTITMPVGYSNWTRRSQIKFNGGKSATIVFISSSYLSITHIYGIKF